MTKIIPSSLISCLILSLCGCETVPDQYGNPQKVLSPQGRAVMNTLVATGVGAASGALLKNQPGWMNGLVSGLAGSVASQLVESVATPRPYNNYNPYPMGPQYYPNQPAIGVNTYRAQMSSARNQVNQTYYGSQNSRQSRQSSGYSVPNGTVLYAQLPNGQFVPIEP